MENEKKASRGIWLAIITLSALVLSTLSGLTFYALSTPIPGVLGVGGVVFVSVITVGLMVWNFLTD
jgi:hypothetical protein